MNVYFDNAATTKMSQVALDAMIPCLENVYANASSLHTPGQKSKEVLEKAREEIAASREKRRFFRRKRKER